MKFTAIASLSLLVTFAAHAGDDKPVSGESMAIATGQSMLANIQAANAKTLAEIRAAAPAAPMSTSSFVQGPSEPVAPAITGVFREDGETHVGVAISDRGRVFLSPGETTPDGMWTVQDTGSRVRLVPAKAAAKRSAK